MNYTQAEVGLKWFKVSVAVKKLVSFYEAECRNQAVNCPTNGYTACPKKPVVLGSS